MGAANYSFDLAIAGGAEHGSSIAPGLAGWRSGNAGATADEGRQRAPRRSAERVGIYRESGVSEGLDRGAVASGRGSLLYCINAMRREMELAENANKLIAIDAISPRGAIGE